MDFQNALKAQQLEYVYILIAFDRYVGIYLTSSKTRLLIRVLNKAFRVKEITINST